MINAFFVSPLFLVFVTFLSGMTRLGSYKDGLAISTTVKDSGGCDKISFVCDVIWQSRIEYSSHGPRPTSRRNPYDSAQMVTIIIYG